MAPLPGEVPWLPSFGVLLAVAGCFLVFSGASGLVPGLLAFPGAGEPSIPGPQPGSAVLAEPLDTRENASCAGIDPAPGAPCAAKPASDRLPAVALAAQSPGAATRSERPRPPADCVPPPSVASARAESAQQASLPLCWDLRGALTAMAASLHPEPARPTRHTDGAGQSASAMLAPALSHHPGLPHGDKHLS